jgi:hypothetical protein
MNFVFKSQKKSKTHSQTMKILSTLFIVATLVVATLQQDTIYVVQYGITDTACSDTFRVYTMPIKCTQTQIMSLTPFVSGSCFGGTAGKRFVSLSASMSPYCNASVVTIISPNANVVEGQCVNRNRYYCSAPPPPTVVVPTGPVVKYNLYGDAQCTAPTWYSSYNETVGCYQHGRPESFERTQCTDSTTVTVTKYFNTFPNPNPTWCSAPYTKDYQFKLGVCAPNPIDSTTYIKYDSCTSDAAAPSRVYVLLFVIAMILSCFVV